MNTFTWIADFFRRLFDTDGFNSLQNQPGWGDGGLIWVHVISDFASASAYLVVFAVLVSQFTRKGNATLPARFWFPIALLVISAIAAFMNVWEFWWPAYRFAGFLKVCSAFTAWAAVFAMTPFLPKWLGSARFGELELQITQRKQAEDALRRTEAAYRSLVDTLPLNLFRKDMSLRIVEANQRFCETIGRPLVSVLNKTDGELFPASQAAKYQRDDQIVLSTGQVLEDVEEHERPDGSKIFVQILKAPLFDDQGALIGLQGMFWDVTEREQADLARRRSDARFRQLVDSSLIGICVADFDGRFIEVNDAFLNMLGYSRGDFLRDVVHWSSLTPESLIPVDHRMIENLRKEGTCLPWEKEYVAKDGKRVPVLQGMTRLSHEPNRCICFVIDISDRKRFERELQMAKEAADAASEAKSQFLANMSHEIRTPMNAILGLSELLLRSPLNSQQFDYLRLVLESGESLLSIINDVLDFSKIESGKIEIQPEPFDLREALVDAIRPLSIRAHHKEIDLAFAIDPEVPESLVGDVVRLRQVVVNLVGNAIKFTPQGAVQLSVEIDSRTDHEITLHFRVSDTGIGIPSEKFRSIFQAFEQADTSTTRNFGGTGLGLAIATKFVELMGGKIWVESSVGAGSVFHFTSRFLIEVPTDEGAEKPDPLRVLLVDRRDSTLSYLRQLFRMRGDSVATSQTIDDAIDQLRRSSKCGDRFDLVLCDAGLATHSDGRFAAEIAGEPAIKTPIIVVVATEGITLLDLSREAGFASRLLSPVKPSELWRAVDAALGKAPATEAVIPDNVELPPLQVLLVEDSLVNQKLAIGILEGKGHGLTIANNGIEAIESIRTNRFDLVLMDVQMPELDGMSATRQIRALEQRSEEGGHIPIIAMTAHALKGDREKCLEAGMDDYISKPVRPKELLITMARVYQRFYGFPGPADSLVATVDSTPPPDHGAEKAHDGSTDPKATQMSETNSLSMAETDQLAFIDWDAALMTAAGDPDLLCDLIDAFQSEHGRLSNELTESLEQRDAKRLQRAAHTLKSSFRYFGIERSADLAYELECDGRDGQFESATPKVATVLKILNIVAPQLENYALNSRSQRREKVGGS